MIEIWRDRVDEPEALHSAQAQEAYAEAARFFRSRARAAHQRQWVFDEQLLYRSNVLQVLRELFDERCAFCTRSLAIADGTAVVHRFRPPQDAVAEDGTVSRRHYWWLAHAWENLYLACEECDRAKGAKFPVRLQRARAGTHGARLDREEPLVIDPCREDPEAILVYLATGEVVSEEPRGQTTIEALDLNRPSLIDLRVAAIVDTKAQLGAVANAMQSGEAHVASDLIIQLYDSDSPLAAVRRQFTNQWVRVRPRQIDAILVEGTRNTVTLESLTGTLRRITQEAMDRSAAVTFGWPMPARAMRVSTPGPRVAQPISPAETVPFDPKTPRTVDRVELWNFRGIGNLSLKFPSAPGSWTMFVGENGTGKSSILQALALAMGGPAVWDRLRLRPRDFLRQGEEHGSVAVHYRGRKLGAVVDLEPNDWIQRDTDRGAPAVMGYGPPRLAARPGTRRSVEMSGLAVANLFDPFRPIPDPNPWLHGLSERDFDFVARALRRMLMLSDDESLVRQRGRLVLVAGRRRLPLNALSDGYQSVATVTLDMMRVLGQAWESFEAAEGVALVDELGVHLHPRWQMRVTHALREAFPRIQFFATTHDPLCLRGLRDGEAVILRRTPKGDIFSIQELPPIEGLEVDQLLTSEYFGLSSTVDPRFEELFDEYYRLRARSEGLKAHEQARLDELEETVKARRIVGRTEAERIAVRAAEEYLAKDRLATSEDEHLELKATTRASIKEIWDRVAD